MPILLILITDSYFPSLLVLYLLLHRYFLELNASIRKLSTSAPDSDASCEPHTQICFGSKAMGGLYESPFNHSRNSHKPLLGLLSYLLPASPRIIPTILSTKIRMMAPIIPTPIYLLSTPIIRLISFKMMFVQSHYHRTSKRHRN